MAVTLEMAPLDVLLCSIGAYIEDLYIYRGPTTSSEDRK